MDDTTFAIARAALGRARREASPLNRVTDDWRPHDLTEAYRLQAAVAEDLGGSGGWKVSAVTAEQQRSLGLDRPVAGALLKRWLHVAGAEPAELELAGFIAPRLECEFAFELAHDLPARPGAAYGRDEVAAAVAAMRIGVEIVDSRLPMGSPTLCEVADAFNNGAYIVGARVSDWRGLDLPSIAIVLNVRGSDGATSELARGNARAILAGDPFAAVVLFANAQPARGPGPARRRHRHHRQLHRRTRRAGARTLQRRVRRPRNDRLQRRLKPGPGPSFRR